MRGFHGRNTDGSDRSGFIAAAVALILILSAPLILTSNDAAVTPGSTNSLIPVSNFRIHENSTAFPIFGISATSNTGDTLDRIDITYNNLSNFDLTDMEPVSIDPLVSGIAVYRDDGTSDDALDPDDSPLSLSSVGRVGRTLILNLSTESVPPSFSGSYHWLLVIRTSDAISSGDQVSFTIGANDIRFSDSRTQPSSSRTTASLRCSFIGASPVGPAGGIPIGEGGVDVDSAAVMGFSIFSGHRDLEVVTRINVSIENVTGFDPWTDLMPMGTGADSGYSFYLDDGSGSFDVWDPDDDTFVAPSLISLENKTGAKPYWILTADFPRNGSSTLDVPSSPSGSFDLFLVASTSSGIEDGDTWVHRVEPWSLEVYGSDNTTAGTIPISGTSRNVICDALAPDLTGAGLSITSIPDTYFYEADTDLSGNDTVYYNSVLGQGHGQKVRVAFSGYEEDNPDALIGEPAFDKPITGVKDDTDSTSQFVIYTIFETGAVMNPLTFTLRDKVGHETYWDVWFIEDNRPPIVENISLWENSPYIDHDPDSLSIYFRPSKMTSTSYFSISGTSYEPDGEAGLARAAFSWESDLHSSPPDDLTAESFNGTYGMNSTSISVDGELKVSVYDRVGNERPVLFSYETITQNPSVTVISPAQTGIEVSGVFRVIADVTSVAPMGPVEFSFDDGANYHNMTYSGISGQAARFIYDWDTFDASEGAHSVRIRATDTTGGIGYGVSWVEVNNYPLWGNFINPVHGDKIRGDIDVTLSVSSFCQGAKLYLGDTLVDSFTGSPPGGSIILDLDTTLFDDRSYLMKAHLTGFGGQSLDLYATITIDNTPPKITDVKVVYPKDQEAAKEGDLIRITMNITDPASGIVISYCVANSIGGRINEALYDDGAHLDGVANDDFYSTANITVSANWGFYTINILAIDGAGNEMNSSIRIPVDPTPPMVARAWMGYPNGQSAGKAEDRVQSFAQISDSTMPIFITLVLDNSGSMGSPQDKMASLKRAAKAFINSTRDIDQVAIYRFMTGTEIANSGSTAPPGKPLRILNFTSMNTSGKQQARSLIDSIVAQAGTPIWDTIGEATQYTLTYSTSQPVVVAFTDGSDNYNIDLPFEEGSENYCPWHDWGTTKTYTTHIGKYYWDLGPFGADNYWIHNTLPPNGQTRDGLLHAPLPIYTIGLGLEHHDPPNKPERTSEPPNQWRDNNAYYSGGQESGTTEYNLWRIATTSAGGSYHYAPEPEELAAIFRDISDSIFSTDNPAKIVQVRGIFPFDPIKEVNMYDDGLHGDGFAGDGLYGSDPVIIPQMQSTAATTLISVLDWADNKVYGSTGIVIDNTLPSVLNVSVIYPGGRSSVADGEAFHVVINTTDQNSGIWQITGDGSGIGFFPPISFNNTGKGNDVSEYDSNYSSFDILPFTGNIDASYHFIDFWIKDYAGNTVRTRGQVLVVNDRYAPIVDMIHPRFDGYLTGDDVVEAKITDDGVLSRVYYELRYVNGTLLRTDRLESEGGNVYSVAIDVSYLAEESYRFEVVAVDTAGRVGSSGLLDIGVDNFIPSLIFRNPANNSAVSGIVFFDFTAGDTFNLEVTYRVDKGPRRLVSEGMDTRLYPEGYHVVEFRVMDGAGQTRIIPLHLFFDNSDPEVDLIRPYDSIMADGAIKILANVVDGGGIKNVEAQIFPYDQNGTPPDHTSVTPMFSMGLKGSMDTPIVVADQFAGSFDSTSLPDGKYLLRILAEDRTGARGESLIYLPVNNHDPYFRVLYPEDNGAVSGNFIPDIDVSDPFLSEVFYTFEGVKYAYNQTVIVSDLPEGRYEMTFVAIDVGSRSTVIRHNVYIDYTQPEVVLNTPADGARIKTDVLEVIGRIVEPGGLKYVYLEMDGDLVVLGEPLGEGNLYVFELDLTPFDTSAHQIRITAENMAGLFGYSRNRTIYKGLWDTDGDGVEDPYDDSPFDPLNHGDIDGDGFGTMYDDDDDGDGVTDVNEPQRTSLFPDGRSKGVQFSLDPDEWMDSDDDGIGDNADPDDDNDGYEDIYDAFPLNASEWKDTDGDGIGNSLDIDDDNDGVIDEKDDLPEDPDEWKDTDGDGIGNNKDDDDDNDGVPDSRDHFPLNKYRSYRWEPILLIVLVIVVCSVMLFFGFVYRERIEDFIETARKEGVRTAVDSIRNPGEKWEGDAGEKERRRPPGTAERPKKKARKGEPEKERPRKAKKLSDNEMEQEIGSHRVKWNRD
ncbi:MAG: hypothetical protein ACMUIG_06845 [Thermoplasmatota archaeon]